MNVVAAVRNYIAKMTDDIGPGMKVMLLDKETTSVVSMVFSQSEITQREVFLFERIDMPRETEPMKYLKCIVFLRPTKENIGLLSKELRNARFGSYYIYMSNILVKADVKALAENDEQEVVRELEEFYADYLAISPYLFSLNVTNCLQASNNWNQTHLHKITQGLASVLLSLKKFPAIRYKASSLAAKKLADKISDLMNKEEDLFKTSDPPSLLLILDRRDDPITPLLMQWTYQAMVHELLGINNNRVNLRGVEGVSKELQEVLLSPLQDEFYAENMYRNYGEIGQVIKGLMDEYQVKAKSHQKLESISDMKHFVENYPQFRKMSGTVSKHVTIVGELSNLVAKRKLLVVSELEQQIACQNQHSQQLQKIEKIISQDGIREEECARVVMLYGLRYANHPNNHVTGLLNKLERKGISQKRLKLIQKVIEFGKKRTVMNDNFGTQEAVKQITKRIFQDLDEVENIYTQHSPILKEILEDLIKGKLKESSFPYHGFGYKPTRVSDVLVFVVGGVTYEESLVAHQLNCTNHPNVRIVLGGSCIHNSTSFLEEVDASGIAS